MAKVMVQAEMQAYLEDHALQWPGVTKRKIFGHDGYYVDGRLFAFIGEGGLVLKPPEEERERVRAFDGARGWSPHSDADVEKSNWVEVPCPDEATIERLLPYLAHAMTFTRTAPQTGLQAERRRKRNARKGLRVVE